MKSDSPTSEPEADSSYAENVDINAQEKHALRIADLKRKQENINSVSGYIDLASHE